MNESPLFGISLILFAVFGVAAGATAYLLPDLPIVWQVTGALAVASLIWHFLVGFRHYRGVFGKRTTKAGLGSVINVLIVIAIAVFINLIANRYEYKADFTQNKIHTLSDQSIKVMQGLKEEVVLKAFVSPNLVQDFEHIFAKWTYYSKKLRREFVDVDKDPLVVQKYNIKQPGVLVVESGERSVRVDNLSGPQDPKLEEKITNAIISVTKGGKKKVYFVTGHGERTVTDTGREGLSEMKQKLEETRYEVEPLVLLEKQTVPTDAEIVVLAGARSNFLDNELKALETFVKAGGKLMILMEPNSSPSLRPLLAKYGVDWKPQRVIIETNSLQQMAGGNPLAPVVTIYDKSHEITRDLDQVTLFPIATPVEKSAAAPEGMKVTQLLSTSTRSFDVEQKGTSVSLQDKSGKKGPLSLAVAASGKVASEKKEGEAKDESHAKEYRVVIVGDTDFAANGARGYGLNADLFQNMMSWLAQEEDLISIRPRSADEAQMELTQLRVRVINLVSMLVAPLIFLVLGIGVWWVRKRR